MFQVRYSPPDGVVLSWNEEAAQPTKRKLTVSNPDHHHHFHLLLPKDAHDPGLQVGTTLDRFQQLFTAH